MKNLLYIGNKVSIHGKTATTIETLSVLLQQEEFEVITASSKKNMLLRMLDMLLQIINHHKTVNYLLIDTYSTTSFWYAFLCSQLARLFKIKYIPILHGGNLPNRLNKNPKICSLIFKNAYYNIAPSGYLKEAFESKGYQNVVFIPNVLEIENYNFLNRKIFEPKLLWVRSFANLYNPQMAIYVLAEIKKNYPNATLTMVGPDKDGSLEKCKSLTKELNVDVNFTGKLSKTDWIKLSENHNIFINTTHFDNTPVSVMEAMALGLPVISTNVGGIPFLLKNKENAFLVNDNSINEMVDAVDFIVKNLSETNKITANARQLSESFDWKVVKNQWNSILE